MLVVPMAAILVLRGLGTNGVDPSLRVPESPCACGAGTPHGSPFNAAGRQSWIDDDHILVS
jgi:hypothetical protein